MSSYQDKLSRAGLTVDTGYLITKKIIQPDTVNNRIWLFKESGCYRECIETWFRAGWFPEGILPANLRNKASVLSNPVAPRFLSKDRMD